MFARPSSTAKPKPLVRKSVSSTRLARDLKTKPDLYESIGLVVSFSNLVDSEVNPDEKCPFCAQCKNCDSKDAGCKSSFADVHNEADIIVEQAFKRFDANLIQLKNPTLAEFSQTFEEIKERILSGTGQKKAFLFSLVGHGVQIKQSLHCMINRLSTEQEDPASESGSIQFFDVERELRIISLETPVIAFLNTNRMILFKEPPVFKFRPDPIVLTRQHRLIITYGCRYGQGMRSYNSTQNYVNHIRSQLQKTSALMLPSAMGMLRGFGQMESMLSFKGHISIKADKDPPQPIEEPVVEIVVPEPPAQQASLIPPRAPKPAPVEEEKKEEPTVNLEALAAKLKPMKQIMNIDFKKFAGVDEEEKKSEFVSNFNRHDRTEEEKEIQWLKIPKVNWACKTPPMTTLDDDYEQEFLFIVPYVFATSSENESRGLLKYIEFREEDQTISALKLTFSNGLKEYESPVFGQKNLLDRKITFYRVQKKLAILHSKGVNQVEFDDQESIAKNMVYDPENREQTKRLRLEPGQEIVGVNGKLKRNGDVSWFSFVISKAGWRDQGPNALYL